MTMVDATTVLDTIRRAVQDAPSAGTTTEDGFSGAALMGLLTALTATLCDADHAYTEIGVYRGLTLATVATHTDAPCVGIDDFSLFNADASNRPAVEARLAAAGCVNATLADSDFEVALRGWADLGHGAAHIGVLFIDGPHDYRSQLMALLLGRPQMREHGVMVVDDANYAHVRQASYDFLAASPDWALVAEVMTPGHPDVVSVEQRAQARAGWWNGVHVLQHDPSHTLPRLKGPATDLSMYVDSHDLFRHRFGPTALAALEGLQRAATAQRTAAADLLLAVLDAQVASAGDRAASQNTDTDTTSTLTVRLAGS
jgi:hypothetical protein